MARESSPDTVRCPGWRANPWNPVPVIGDDHAHAHCALGGADEIRLCVALRQLLEARQRQSGQLRLRFRRIRRTDQTNSMRAMGAASPWRGPSFKMRV